MSGNVEVVVLLANAAAGTLQDTMLGANDLLIKLGRSGDMRDITPALKSLKVNMNDLIYIPSVLQYQGKGWRTRRMAASSCAAGCTGPRGSLRWTS